MKDNRETYLLMIFDWQEKKKIDLAKYKLSKDELIDFCKFCKLSLEKEIAKAIVCYTMRKIIEQESKTKNKK